MRLLVAEDEKDLNDVITKTLIKNHYSVDSCQNGREALDCLAMAEYDAIILDIMMPGINGLEVLKKLRSAGNKTPVLLLTALDSVPDRVAGLDGGADDYVTKPFGVLELAARIRSLLRRASEQQPVQSEGKVRLGGLCVDTAAREVAMNGEPVVLTYKEYELLMYLIDNRARVVERDELLNKLWDYTADIETRTLDIHIRTLRQKLGEEGSRYIKTIRSVGYRFVLPQETENRDN